MMAAINSIDGMIYTKISKQYFKQADTIEFVKMLIDKNKSKKICLFWDNASVHVGKEISEYLNQIQNLKVIQNIVYEPENNGIEFLWSKMKHMFRSKLTELKIKSESFDINDIMR